MPRSVFLGSLAGLLFALALPNEYYLFGNPWLSFISLVPLFTAIYRSPDLRTAGTVGAVFGGVSTVVANYWLWFFKDFAYLTLGSVTVAYTIIYGVVGIFLWRFSRSSGPGRPFILAALWVVFEYVKSIGFLAYPWGLIAFPVNGWLPLLQIADLAGLWSISFLVVLVNLLLAELLDRVPGGREKEFRVDGARWIFCGFLFLLFFSYGFLRMALPIPIAGTVKAVLVQQNVDPWDTGKYEAILQQAQNLSKSGAEKFANKADLIVWSESSLIRPYKENRPYYDRVPAGEPFTESLRNLHTPLLTGNPVIKSRELRQVLNGVIFLDPNGEILDTYGKRHPVPMAEYVPFWDFKIVRTFFQKYVGLDSIWTLGDRDTIFNLSTKDGTLLHFGAPICFEDAFPYLCRRLVNKGADFLLNLTNDSWSRTNSAQIQHFVVARFRSIEMKRVLVRSTNAGLTCVIGPFGEILSSLPMFEERVLATEIPVYREENPTFYTTYGDYLPQAFALGLLLLLLRDQRRRKAI